MDEFRESRERFFIRASPLLRGSEGPPAEPRPSVTIVPIRDAAGGPEVLLLRRPLSSRFAAGAWVFPGGMVDPGDRVTPLDVAHLRAWARRLSLAPEAAHAHLVAAIRETWEETGLLLGQAPAPWAEAGEERRRVIAGELSFASVVRGRGWGLGAEDLAYFAHWVTPEAQPRRYDTRFLLARVDRGAPASLIGDELTDLAWWRPGEAADAARRGELDMLLPTVHSLRRLAGGSGTGELLHQARRAPVLSYLPEPAPHPEGHVVTLRVLGRSEPLPRCEDDPNRTHE